VLLSPAVKSRSFPAVLVALAVVVLGAAVATAVWTAQRTGDPPVIQLEVPEAVGPRNSIKVSVEEAKRGIGDVVVEVEGAGVLARTVAETHLPVPTSAFAPAGQTRVELQAEVGKLLLPTLVEGSLVVRVTATVVGTWWKKPDPVVVEKTVAVRLTPPSVTPVSSFVHVAQGGAEVVVYDVGPSSVFDGVVVERPEGASGPVAPWVFPGQPLPGGPATRHFAFFVVPYDDDGPEAALQSRVRVFAQDGLGNRATAAGVVHKFFPRPMGKDTIELKDPFLTKVTTEVYGATPDLVRKGTLLDDYLQLNRDLRQRNNAFLVDLAQKTAPRFLWSKVFRPFDNAAIKGAFADRRNYTREGAVVDTQDHLGFDLARVERSPVGAGNDGIVVFAGTLGIYGNCVVVDHGYGLMTLYAHLSSMSVKEGDVVARGGLLGTTGATGLAGGDHLHFTTLVHGRPSNPIEWWDAHWITDRIALKLGTSWAFDDEGGAGRPARSGRAPSRRR
jgi:murein DD-endopeptidase MepM/ murein hydrolase activator NlpD